MKQTIITTSWDDGHKLDLRLARLLKKYNIKATFYISPKNREFKKQDYKQELRTENSELRGGNRKKGERTEILERSGLSTSSEERAVFKQSGLRDESLKKQDLLSDKEVKELSRDFEIGAHTMTHPRLTKVSEEQAQKEIIESRKYLEGLIKKKVKCFCYPGGDYNNKIKEFVRKAGFVYARGVKQISTKYPKDVFESNTTIHAFPLSFRGMCGEIKYSLKHEIKLLPCLFTKDWEKTAKRIFDYVLKNGGVYHLWGHSWMIDKHKDWDKLERVLSYISKKENVKYLTNSELILGRKK